MGVGQIVDQSPDKKIWVYGIDYVEKKMGNNEQDLEEKKMGVGQIVEQNSDKKRWVYSINYVEQQIRIATLMMKK